MDYLKAHSSVGVSKLVPNEKKILSLELTLYERPTEGFNLSNIIELDEVSPISLISYRIPYRTKRPESNSLT